MKNYILISDFFSNDQYRASFNELAMNTFQLDFEEWYQKKLFYHRYICYSYIHQEKVIANVSITKMDLVVDGQEKKAIKIGAVMTHPKYRKQGLAAALLNHIIEKYENEYGYDILYLYPNESVLAFYPKFGFTKGIECTYELDVKQLQRKKAVIRKLKISEAEDFQTIVRLGTDRQPISQQLGVCNDRWPLFVYCFYEYKDDLYYVADEDAIVLLKKDTGVLHLYDVLSQKPIDLERIIEKIVMPGDQKVKFHFTPELAKYSHIVSQVRQGDILFVRSKNTLLENVLFPMTSH